MPKPFLKPFYKSKWITLYLGDCLEILPLLQSANFDAVITDPPYCIKAKFGSIRTRAGYGDGRSKGTRKLQFDWDTQTSSGDIAERLAMSFAQVKHDGSAFVFCGFDSAEAYSNPAREAGFTVKPAAWIKKHPPPAGFGTWWPSAFELAFYAYRRRAYFNDKDPKRKNYWVYDSYRYGQPGKCNHPTQKPLGLMREIVCAMVPHGGIVLDPFIGSGTTALACLEEGCRCVGIEKDQSSLEIAVSRLGNREDAKAIS